MKIDARWLVAIAIVWFSWKGADLSMNWSQDVRTPRPAQELMALGEPLRPILPKMVVKDRQYLASLYEAMAFVLTTDGQREKPIIADTARFVQFHAATLNLAIKKENVGKYDGLGEAIDAVFLNAVGADQKALDTPARNRLIAACGVLSWAFAVGGDG